MYLKTEPIVREWPHTSTSGKKYLRKRKTFIAYFKCDNCGASFERQPGKDIDTKRCNNSCGHYCSKCPAFALAAVKGQKTKAKQRLKQIGKRTMRSTGHHGPNNKYAWVYVGHDYPYSKPYCGSILEHIMVMEYHLRRAVNDDEIVHHIDGNKLNNDIGNLDTMTQQQHNKCHGVAARTLVFELLADGIVKYNRETKRYEKNY